MGKILVLQVRPEVEASDSEYEAFLDKGNLKRNQTERICLDKEALPGDFKVSDFDAVIVGGGPACVSTPYEEQSEEQRRFDSDLLRVCDEVYEKDIPFLGACYGIGILAKHQGSVVSKEKYGEPVGATHVTRTKEGEQDPIVASLPKKFTAFCGHKEAVQSLPDTAVLLLTSETCPVQMIRVKQNIYATQFHPELDTGGIVLRINVYKHAGYFPIDEAEDLIHECKKSEVFVPEAILSGFVDRYVT